MNSTNTQSSENRFWMEVHKVRPAIAFGVIIVIALLAFETFNYSTTDYALKDLLGDFKVAGIPWATVLTIAFCGIDFAGIARLFTPQNGADEPKEVWYLFGAWLLAATMNAILTWWGVSLAVAGHSVKSTAVVDAATVIRVVPVFVAIMVWVIRILIIGSLSVAGEKFIWGDTRKEAPARRSTQTAPALFNPAARVVAPRPIIRQAAPSDDAPARPEPAYRPEPTYHSAGMSARPVSGADSKKL